MFDKFNIATYQDEVQCDPTQFKAYEYPDPTFVLCMFNPDIRSGAAEVYDWQIRVHERFAQDHSPKVNRQAVVANNGSGKSQFVIAPCAVWFAMKYIQSRTVITSASGTQLDKQTCNAIKILLQNINAFYKETIWKINYRHYVCLRTGSEIVCYATDEPGKAEGFHPMVINGKFAVLVDEGKSIQEPIYGAISRCNGLTHRIDVSSPGAMFGHFYTVVTGGRWFVTKVTYKECPHIKQDEVDEAKMLYGENSPLFRSMYLAEFTSTSETIVIPYDELMRYIRMLHIDGGASVFNHYNKGRIRIGFDLSSTGKDESVGSVWDGCKQIAQEVFRIQDTTATPNHMKFIINKYGAKPEDCCVDDGNVGKGIIDRLWLDGYHVNRVLNQSTALDTRVYANRGAETWFNFAKGISDKILIPLNEPVLLKQLGSRYYRQHKQSGKIVLESKPEARANGHGSPDRADAAVLAFAKCGPFTFDQWYQDFHSGDSQKPKAEKVVAAELTADRVIELMQQRKKEQLDNNFRRGRSARISDLLRRAKQV